MQRSVEQGAGAKVEGVGENMSHQRMTGTMKALQVGVEVIGGDMRFYQP